MSRAGPPTLSTCAIALIAASVALFVLVGGVALNRLQDARERIAASNQAAAGVEIERAVAVAVEHARQNAAALADWDETRQQLRNPTYYAFWREYRLRSTDILPAYFKDAALYDASGKVLGRLPNATLPETLPADWAQPHLETSPTGPDLILYAPIQTGGAGTPAGAPSGTPIGTLGLRIDFRDALLRLNRFRYINDASLTLEPPEARPYTVAEIPALLRYRLVDTPETLRLEQAMGAGLRDLSLLVGGLSLAFYLALMFLLASPLRRLCRHIDGLRAGGGGLQLRQFAHTLPVAELEKVRTSLNEYQAELDGVHHDLNRKNRELRDLIHTDALTGVHNRRAFEDDWQRALDQLGERDRPQEVSFLLVDCNHFKSINDSYGHAVGDEVIRLLARATQPALRPGDRLYRLGGDEFAAILLDCPLQQAREIAAAILRAVAATDFRRLGIDEPIRVSLGLAQTLAAAPADLADLHWQADAAMYAAKRPGSPGVIAYNSALTAAPKTLFSSRMANAVYEAVTQGTGLHMYYQPVVELATGRITHYEALLRIARDDEIITPYSIMPLVEARSLEVELDRAVLARVALDLAQGQIPPGTGVAVNLAGPTLLDGGILADLKPLAAFLPAYRILIEITETALITRLDLAGEVLQHLRGDGFQVALDDFGSGYSSLRYLAQMPIDLVKFDITLVRSLESDSAQGGLVEDLARLILKAGYQIVAEGIESERVGRRIGALGCRYGQGYLFGHPQPQCLAPGPFRLQGTWPLH